MTSDSSGVSRTFSPWETLLTTLMPGRISRRPVTISRFACFHGVPWGMVSGTLTHSPQRDQCLVHRRSGTRPRTAVTEESATSEPPDFGVDFGVLH